MRKFIIGMIFLLGGTGVVLAAVDPPYGYPIRLRTGDNTSQWDEMAFFIKTSNGRDYYKGGDGGQHDPRDLNKVFFWIYSAGGNYLQFSASAYIADCITRSFQRVYSSHGRSEAELNDNIVPVSGAPIRLFTVGDPATLGAHFMCEKLYQ